MDQATSEHQQRKPSHFEIPEACHGQEAYFEGMSFVLNSMQNCH